MKITNIKINGILNPLGFSYDHLVLSARVTDTKAKKQTKARIEVSETEDFSQLVYEREASDIDLAGEELSFPVIPRNRYFVRVFVWGDNGECAVSESAYFETAKMDEKWEGKWITTRKEDTFHPVFSKKFSCNKKVASARIYICGLGCYEAYLNGNKLGEDYLAPFIHDYNEEQQYQTYSMTEYLKNENEIKVILGNGWYKGEFGLEHKNCNYGEEFLLIGELHIKYEDGSEEVIPTDETWKYQGSDIEDSGIYFGEVLNRQLWKDKENLWKKAVYAEKGTGSLVARYSVPVKAMEAIKPVELIYTPAGEIVLDMGQNFAGYVEFEVDCMPGKKIVLDFGEVLQQGNFYRDNYREAKSQFVYISKGGYEKVRPHFTFFGLRYVKITGWPGEVKPEAFTGWAVYSEMERTGYIDTSDKKINRLYANSVWGLKSNFLDMPTDCPQRDERMAWTGDAQVFAATASYHMDTRAFYYKFMRDLRREQDKCFGGIPNYLPNMGNLSGCGSVWGDIATILPATLCEMYDNKADFQMEYKMMKDWVDYIHQEDIKHGENNLFNFGFHFGDWLALDGITEQSFKGGTEDTLVASVYYYHSAILTKAMAERLGETEDVKYYANLAERIKEAIYKEYFTPTGRLAMDTQAAYIICLKYGLAPNKEKLLEGFRNRLKKDCYKIKCGFVGAPLLCTTLCENGMEEMAYHFLFEEEFPSWLYSVNLGATTIWERWNSLLPDGTVSGTGMNSFNHYAYGSVMEFVYKYVVGIRPLEAGFKKAKIAPVITGRFRYVKGSFASQAGNYECHWQIEKDGQVKVKVSIPFNRSAVVCLPGYSEGEMELTAGDYEFSYYPEKDYRKPYGETTFIGELSKDGEALEILKKYIPQAYGMALSQDKENLSLRLFELKWMFYMGIVPENVEKAIEELKELVRFPYNKYEAK